MSKSRGQTKEGDTLLADKSKLPAKYIEVSKKDAERIVAEEKKPREKKPLSEKQQANLQRLIEMNKRRREERIAQMKVNVDDLGEIPEDKVVIKVVKSKGGRPVGSKTRKQEPEDHEVVELPAKKPVLQREKKQVPRRPLSPPTFGSAHSAPSETEEEEKEPVRKPRKKLEKAGKIVDKKRSVVRKPRYVSETSETEAQGDDEDSESDYEEERVKKYVAKTKARMEALKQIETQLKPQSKYAGMSIF